MYRIKFYILITIFCGITLSVSAQNNPKIFEKNPNYVQQMGLYKIYKLKSANIVMLGNSITHGANWNELLGRTDVVERGITSDILLGYLNRLEFVTDLNPKVCFVMGGINDIYNWRPVEQIFEDYKKLIIRLKIRGIQPVIQSTLYVGKKWPSSDDRNQEVKKFNSLLENYAKQEKLVFVDLNSEMSFLGYLKENLTYDGIHLNANGFKIWAERVEKTIKELGI
ncbi:MAG: hypothetical protein K9J12_13390 [Melioribacteraceae bacterium]|nr:hypothetical protein [Melioribacteraceae bacterium]MCF8412834.1 hypothetical protein [Melioribacteraceae bacterium]MCF8431313.1 hypothetical protein [Melioribacteraceae bacterium]